MCCMAVLSIMIFDNSNKQIPLTVPAIETNEHKEVREEIRHILEQQFSK